ncbi:hypothetical protein J1N35_043812 [Gossypium stocksii]|uniref:CCHC-type domain-containing protein n=1 Tax=Gossypium stocksii TaxID=47602 RepID=A0A9D3U8D3_9ROSI|nr:hypothetical protein J1N35_043812 [Gossypium stocksii]
MSETPILILEISSKFDMDPKGSDNPELGTEALIQLVKEVLEKVFEASIKGTSEMFQARCIDCREKRDNSPPRLEPQSAKCVRMHLCGNKGFAEGACNGVSVLFCEHCKKRHSGNYWKKAEACFQCGSTKHWIRNCPHNFESGVCLRSSVRYGAVQARVRSGSVMM